MITQLCFTPPSGHRRCLVTAHLVPPISNSLTSKRTGYLGSCDFARTTHPRPRSRLVHPRGRCLHNAGHPRPRHLYRDPRRDRTANLVKMAARPGHHMDAYSIKMRNLHRRYNLSKNVLRLFDALDEHRRGARDPDALARQLRLSPQMRQTCLDTIASLAEAMQKKLTPDCLKDCSELISCCADMLALGSEFVDFWFPFPCHNNLPCSYTCPVEIVAVCFLSCFVQVI